MNLSDQQQLFALNVSTLIAQIHLRDYRCTLGEAFRTEEQAEIYAKSGKGIEDSLHCKRLAIDLALFSPLGRYLTDSALYEPFGVFWESLHPLNQWGGRWTHRPDGNHFEMKEKHD